MPEFDLPDHLSPRLLRAVADHSFDAITITRAAGEDGPGEIVYVNDAFTDLTGYEADEVMGQTPGVLQGPNTEQSVLDRLSRRLSTGNVFHGETANYRKDGSEFTMEWKVVPVGQENGDGDETYHVAVQREAPGDEESTNS